MNFLFGALLVLAQRSHAAWVTTTSSSCAAAGYVRITSSADCQTASSSLGIDSSISILASSAGNDYPYGCWKYTSTEVWYNSYSTSAVSCYTWLPCICYWNDDDYYSTPSITILTPSDGSTYYEDDQISITWNSNGLSDSYIKFYICGALCSSACSSCPTCFYYARVTDDGEAFFTYPTSGSSGGYTHFFCLQDNVATSPYDYSSAFTIYPQSLSPTRAPTHTPTHSPTSTKYPTLEPTPQPTFRPTKYDVSTAKLWKNENP